MGSRLFKKNEYELLNRMLDDAIGGNFEEDCFDESELSKLQTKLMRYLSSASMSERKISEEKDSLKELITNISHQTRTPLTNILMYSELLKEVSAGQVTETYADEIYLQGKKLESLIEALVKMSRLEIGIFQYEISETRYSKIISKAVDQALLKAKDKDIRICVNNEQDYQVLLDEKWVVEAAYNIIDNAVKYSDSGTSIYIEAFSYEMFSGIRIRDEGPGIDEAEIPLMFGRFYRGRSVHDREGIGVGLYLAREITEANGGYIKVRSRPGQGSTFELCFPNVSDL